MFTLCGVGLRLPQTCGTALVDDSSFVLGLLDCDLEAVGLGEGFAGGYSLFLGGCGRQAIERGSGGGGAEVVSVSILVTLVSTWQEARWIEA